MTMSEAMHMLPREGRFSLAVRLRAAALPLLLALNLAASAGCDSREPTYPVKGRVVYKDDGKPFTGGTVIWFESTKPPDYVRSMGQLDGKGEFVLSTDREGNGAMEGKHRVSIGYLNSDGMSVRSQLEKILDPKHFEFSTSGIEVDIKSDAPNDFTIEVDRPGKR